MSEISELVDQLLFDAIHQHASDIHFEPQKTMLYIRVRIDGILHELTSLSKQSANSIISRLKIMAKLDIAEKRLPQDGRFSITTPNSKQYHCRLSSCPTHLGEKVVIRILDSTQSLRCINQLGLTTNMQQYFLNAIHRPEGLILVTGPTGSGKTITLYAALNEINTVTKNIITAEDPIEICIPGINQLNIHPHIGLDFAESLRAFLRQDPDVIMIGEIRDYPTAEIAISAAHTGHLVLSTLHTRSAAETITRLHNIGIAPYNLASALTLVIAQRLVRRLCPHCKKQATYQQAPLLKNTAYIAAGCEACNQGYLGRQGIFELMPITQPLRQAILTQQNATKIQDQAQQEGMIPLWQEAINQVNYGTTSLKEIHRVGYCTQ